MIIVTGGAGFIGSNIVNCLNRNGVQDIIVVDDLEPNKKHRYLDQMKYTKYVHKDELIDQILPGHGDYNSLNIEAIIHMGACSSTTEMDINYLKINNTQYTQILAEWCIERAVRFIYASSAATYGDGAFGFDDDLSKIDELQPLNPYGWSKQNFDLWAKSNQLFDKIVGLKFFNVFGPNESHKGSMRSMICKAKEQIDDSGYIQLFKSYRSEYTDGGQMRDFIYVKDCTTMIMWLLNHPDVNGLFNYGFGTARTWNDLAASVFKAMNQPIDIRYIDMPDNIKDQYQYHTEATMARLKSFGCPMPEYTLEAAVSDYVRQYL